MSTTLLTPKTPLDLFDYRYGEHGAILYRKGNPPVENSEDRSEVTEDEIKALQKIAGKKLRQLPELLVFPERPEDLEEDIKDDFIFEMEEIKDYLRISTYNLIGFICCGGVRINIHSRFEENKPKEGKKITDFFLIYMLAKISRLNLLDLQPPSSDDVNVFDLLPFLFPHYLRRALVQGMYKEYVHRKYNDSNVKGTIDVSRHIRSNIPFLGKVAYNTREFSYDNRVTQLIRHTIEHIRSNSAVGEEIVNSPEVHDMVREIVDATPSYSMMDRQKVIRDNLKPFAHPYYNEYGALQELCLAILRYDQISYGDSDQEVHGVVFDIAALWEEYLAVVLEDCGDIVHPNNREKTNPQYLFVGDKYPRYPDFFRKDPNDATKSTCVFDAKYKRIADFNNKIDRDDIHQLITYMYILQAAKGVIISPAENAKDSANIGTLNGYGGNVEVCYVHIPDNNDYNSFCKIMEEEEQELIEKIWKTT